MELQKKREEREKIEKRALKPKDPNIQNTKEKKVMKKTILR